MGNGNGSQQAKRENKEISLVETHSHLAAEWADDRNLSDFTAGSAYVAQWKCVDGLHDSYPQSISSKVRGRAGCLVCNGYHVLIGYNDLLTTNPELVEAWVDSRPMSSFSPRSKKEVWWKCFDYEHEYSARIVRVVSGYGCTYCSGRRVLVGFNDLATTHPHLVEEWADERKITEFSRGQQYKATWGCSQCSLTWEASILHRSKGKGCPYCVGRKVLKGHNDLATTHPHLVVEWADEKSVHEVTQGSAYSAVWKCSHGHTWRAVVYNRTGRLRAGCPVCTGNAVLAGLNDLATTHPDYVSSWADKRNVTTVSAGSDYLAEWKCVNDDSHDNWKSRVYSRVSKSVEYGCPQCSGHISYGEYEVLSYVTQELGFDAERNREVLDGKELDIYIPEKQFAIEYNGLYWHSEAAGKMQWDHYRKWEQCQQRGVQLLVIWEDDWRDRKDVIKSVIAHKLSEYCEDDSLSDAVLASVSQDFVLDFHYRNSVDYQQVVQDILRPEAESTTEHYALTKEPTNVDTESGNSSVFGVLSVKRKGSGVEIVSWAVDVSLTNSSDAVFERMLAEFQGIGDVSMVTMTTSNDSDSHDYAQYGFVNMGTLEPKFTVLTSRGSRLRIEEYDDVLHDKKLRIWDYGYQVWEKSLI